MRHAVLALPLLLATHISAADIAPTGTLRAAFLQTNPVQGRIDPSTGAVTGPVADLTKELARRLNVPFTMIPAPDARAVIDHLKNHTADIGFLAFDPERAAEVHFSAPYALMHNSYLVRADSPLRKTADVDRAGVRVATVKGQSQQLFLSANLKNAQVKILATMPPQAELEKLFGNGEIDAFGANRLRMEEAEAAAKSPKLRVLPDNFSSAGQAIVIEGEPSRLEALNRFLTEALTSGLVKASIDRAKISGVDVAPPPR